MCLHIRLSEADDAAVIPIYCAIRNEVNDNFILTADAIRRLPQSSMSHSAVVMIINLIASLTIAERTIIFINFGEVLAHASERYNNEIKYTIDVLPSTVKYTESKGAVALDATVLPNNPLNRNRLMQNQWDDVTLSSCWKLWHSKKIGFHLKDDLLLYQQSVVGQTIDQLCVPKRSQTFFGVTRTRSDTQLKQTITSAQLVITLFIFLTYDETWL